MKTITDLNSLQKEHSSTKVMLDFYQKRYDQEEQIIKSIEDNLSKLTGIEYKLFYKIKVTGISVSKAVEQIAEDNNNSIETVWRIYKKIKDLI